MRETINDELKIKDIDKIEKINGESLDIVKENVKKLKEIFPEVFCEDKIDFKRLEEVLGEYTDNSDERYRFEWHGKSKAIKLSQTPSKGTLRPCKEESKNWDTTENLYIEGDNLEVLKLLQKSYQGKIKMIYIDPPYNTGNDFIYPDNYKDNMENYLNITGQKDNEGNKISTNSETDGSYHTKWLNMMYPRLRLARNLLTDDGVIFISIDDNEVNNLKKVCNEVFGEENAVALLTIIVKTEGRRYGFFAKTHENMIVFAKDNESLQLNEIEIEGSKFAFNDDLGGFNIRDLRNQNARAFNDTNRPNLRYPFYVDEDSVDSYGFCQLSLSNNDNFVEVYPIIVNGYNSVWRWGKEKAKREIHDLVARKSLDGTYRIFQKSRKLSQTAKTVWIDKEFISNKGTKEINEILKKNLFDFPKPIELIKRVLDIGSNPKDIILDFFSGSATTAHAVMKLNSEDNGNRKFVMVQLPEECDEKSEAYKAGYKNICEIGKERIRRAGDKIVEENKGKEGIEDLDIGFKVFKLDTSNIKPWNPDYDNLKMTLEDSVDNFVPGRTEEDILYEIMLKYGIDLTYPVDVKEICGKKLFSVGFGALIVCLDSDITLELVNEIIKYKNELNPKTCRVVFRDNGFKTDSVKTNAIETLHRNNIKEIMSI